MISCGEPSGDLYAGALAVEIRRRQPGAAIFGLGGQRLMAGGGELVADYRGLSVTGLVEALRVLPKSLSVLNRLVEAAKTEKPNALVVIDFPDFNFRLAAAVKKLGIPIIYYISPQLWAWRKSRMQLMKRLADRVLVIFPFEERIYQDAGVPVQFVGHPLVDLARAQEPKDRFLQHLGLDGGRPIVALLPGSRPNEVERLLPVMRDAVARIVRQLPGAQFVIARAPALDDRLFSQINWNRYSADGGAREDRRCARDFRCGGYCVRHGDGAGRVARTAHGRRLPVVAGDVPGRPTLSAGRQCGHGQSDCRTPHRARAYSGRMHGRGHCCRNVVVPDQSTTRRRDEAGAR